MNYSVIGGYVCDKCETCKHYLETQRGCFGSGKVCDDYIAKYTKPKCNDRSR